MFLKIAAAAILLVSGVLMAKANAAITYNSKIKFITTYTTTEGTVYSNSYGIAVTEYEGKLCELHTTDTIIKCKNESAGVILSTAALKKVLCPVKSLKSCRFTATSDETGVRLVK